MQAKERAWGEQTIREKWGGREHSLTVSFSSRAFLEMPATQAMILKLRGLAKSLYLLEKKSDVCLTVSVYRNPAS